ncbi:MAG: SLBB domain-containing protein [Parabacteroides sp.]|nr:SLBB domain-containing protein [Parabacteroides sp.]MDD3508452.1 SLBB domain-containing protein [Parabacteroides sp.]
MRKISTLILCYFVFSGVLCAQSMSDDQVIQYVKQAQTEGKSQNQMAIELKTKGVTTQQVERIKKKYEDSQGVVSKNDAAVSISRNRNINPSKVITPGSLDQVQTETGDPIQKEEVSANEPLVFGRDVFTNKNLSFEPNSNMATPANYLLGPGDQVIIDIWGASQNTFSETISPDGNINVKNLGPVYLNGLTINEANAYVQRKFNSIYSGVLGGTTSNIKLTLGQIRSIQINIMGEVAVPGTYTLSAFSSVFHALYRAGGVNAIGSLRNIKVMRGGKLMAALDVYDYILKGKFNDDIRLMEGDVIIVSPYDCLVNISGNVKRPLFYEMKTGESLATLLHYAGGFTGDAYSKTLRLMRKSGREHQIFNIDAKDFDSFKLTDGDVVTVGAVLDRFENRVEIKGAVYREGLYELSTSVNSVKSLIEKAEGITGDAFMNRAELRRQHEDLTLEIIPIDLKGLLNGETADVPLQKNDILYIPSIHDLQEAGILTIHGEVARPGVFPFAKNTTLEDLVVQAGGLMESASTVRVDIARRIKDPKSMKVSREVGQTFSFSLKDGFIVDGTPGFVLEPFDEVYVRRSPGYHAQQNVTVTGEVVFGGRHAVTEKNERLSDLIRKAGGLTREAYPQGARLLRKMTPEEIARQEKTLEMAARSAGKDSIDADKLVAENIYPVGITLEKALANPGSDADLVLREGDELFVPQYVNTVKINGTVMFPNTVLYEKGKRLNHYINQAGGYGQRAQKNKVYVVYMNGTVAQVKGGSSKYIQPGCEIIVPNKPDKKGMSLGEIIGLSSSIASLGAIVATLLTLTK